MLSLCLVTHLLTVATTITWPLLLVLILHLMALIIQPTDQLAASLMASTSLISSVSFQIFACVMYCKQWCINFFLNLTHDIIYCCMYVFRSVNGFRANIAILKSRTQWTKTTQWCQLCFCRNWNPQWHRNSICKFNTELKQISLHISNSLYLDTPLLSIMLLDMESLGAHVTTLIYGTTTLFWQLLRSSWSLSPSLIIKFAFKLQHDLDVYLGFRYEQFVASQTLPLSTFFTFFCW